MKITWGLHECCKETGSRFPSPLLLIPPSSDCPYVEERCHAVGWYLTLSQDFLLNRLLRIIEKQVAVTLHINCYVTGKINLNHSSESQNTLAMITPPESCIWIFWVVQIPCDAVSCSTALDQECNCAPTSRYRSLFALCVCLLTTESDADLRQTQKHAAPSGRRSTSLRLAGILFLNN
jgi:hypothetical protein